MYTPQNGKLPFITTLLGILIPCVSVIAYLRVALPVYAASIDSMPINIIAVRTFQVLVGLILYSFMPFMFGIFFSGWFPALWVREDSLRYAYFGGLIQKRIRWDELDKLVELRWGVVALVIDRPGLFALNGLYWNDFYGKFTGIRQPVILISSATKGFDRLMEEIIKRNSKLLGQLQKQA